MAKTNWQDPQTSEIRSTHISGLQEAVGKFEESIGIASVFEENISLTEVFISNDDRCRIYQAPEGKRNWLASPAPVIMKNDVIITEDFEIDYGGGGIIFMLPLEENDTLTANATYTINESVFNENIEITKSPIGFPNRADSTFIFDKSTRTFTIEPTDTSYEVFFKDKKFTKDSPESFVIPDVTGLYYIYFNQDGILSANTSFPGLQNMIYISYVYWNENQAIESLQFGPGDERHGTVMDKATHERLHAIDWTQWVRGLQLYDYTMGDSDNNDAVKVSLNNGVVADEDLFHNITHSPTPSVFFEQILQDFALLPVMYREGINGDWKQDEATEYPFKNTSSGRVNFNEYDEIQEEWIQTEVPDGEFVAYYIAFTADVEQPIKVIQGQRIDSSLSDAQANNDDRDMQWGNSPFQEFKVLYRLILQTDDSYSNDRKVALRDVLDLRAARRSPGGGGIIPSAHSNLTGLDYASSGHTGFASQQELDALSNPNYSTPQTTHSPVISLPDEAKHGKLKYKLKGRTISNSVLNGNFKLGTSGWSFGGQTASVTNNELTVTQMAGFTIPTMTRPTNTGFIAGNKCFFRLYVRPESFVLPNVLFRVKGSISGTSTTLAMKTGLPSNIYSEFMGVATLPSGHTGNIDITISLTHSDATGGRETRLKDIVVIPITGTTYENMTAEEINARIPHYVDGTQSAGNVEVKVTGKNLFDKNKMGFNKSVDHMTGNIVTIQNINISDFIKIKGNTVYHKTLLRSCAFYDKNKNYISGVSTTADGVITTPSNAHFVVFNLNYDGKLSQLEEGTTPTEYEPYKESKVLLDTLLPQLPNGVRNALDDEGNLDKRVEHIVLDGSLNWLYDGAPSGLKVVKVSGFATNTGATTLLVVYDGSTGGSHLPVGTPHRCVTVNDTVFLVLSNTTTGWGDSYTPTANEIKAYFNGWVMFQEETSGLYNGTGTKKWSKIYSGQGPIWTTTFGAQAVSGSGTTVLPTTMNDMGYNPYQLYYQLAEPKQEKLNIPPLTTFGKGQISLKKKKRYVLKADDVIDIFTLTNVSRARVELSILKNIATSTSGIDNIIEIKDRVEIPTTQADSVESIDKFHTSTTHLHFILPKGTTLAQAQQLLAGTVIEYETKEELSLYPEMEYSYAENIKASVDGAIEGVNQVVQVVKNVEDGLDAKANIVQENWITPTLLNGWIGSGTFGVKYYKDTIGNVRIQGGINSGTTTRATTLFILNEGYRPTITDLSFAVRSATSSTPFETLGVVLVKTTGEVQILIGSNNNLSFNFAFRV